MDPNNFVPQSLLQYFQFEARRDTDPNVHVMMRTFNIPFIDYSSPKDMERYRKERDGREGTRIKSKDNMRHRRESNEQRNFVEES